MTTWSKLIPAMLISSMAITGCAAGGLSKKMSEAAVPAVAKGKPPLVVPASFANDGAKRDFALKAVADGFYRESLPLLNDLSQGTTDASLYEQLGVARFNVKDFTGAAEAWTKAAELNPTMAAEMKNNIGNALRESHKVEEAEAAYREALKIDPKRWTAAVNLATELKTGGKLDEAIGVLKEAVSNNKDVAVLSELLTDYQHDANMAKPHK